jgi:hypothetical protein
MEKGKALEMLFAASLLLYSRSNDVFKPSDFCNSYHCASDLDVELIGGAKVEYLTVDKFPPFTGNDIRAVSAEDIQSIVGNLAPNSPGAIIIPLYKSNINGDIIGLFRTSEKEGKWTLLIIQCKDWFFDLADKNVKSNVVDKWRNNRKILFPNSEIKFTNGNRIETVKVLHILLSANELEGKDKLQCNDCDGAGSIQTMRTWLPTATFACESAKKLREIFAPTS